MRTALQHMPNSQYPSTTTFRLPSTFIRTDIFPHSEEEKEDDYVFDEDFVADEDDEKIFFFSVAWRMCICRRMRNE